MRPRTTDDGLPRHVYLKHGSYYYVDPSTRKWIRLARDRKEAIAAHRKIMSLSRGSSDSDALAKLTGHKNSRVDAATQSLSGTRPRACGDDLPRYVYFKNGAYYYVDPSTRKWMRLSKDKEEALALHRQIVAPFIDTTNSSCPNAIGRARQVRLAVELLERAKPGAASRNLRFALTKQDVFDLIDSANGRCMLTDIPFSDESVEGTRKRLWRPSLDRINSSRGYEAGNVRLVCVAANFALQEHGDPVFQKLAFAYVLKCLKSTPRLADATLLDIEISATEMSLN